MTDDYVSRCRERVAKHGDLLHEEIRAGRLNASAFTRLIEGYVDQPGFAPEWRAHLIEHELARWNPRSPLPVRG